MALKNYIYSHKKAFLKNPNSTHSRANFLGQVYEASFFEALIGGQVDELPEKAQILAKPPYAKRKFSESGFRIENDGAFVYASQGVPMGEFDALAYSEEEIRFYECFLSRTPAIAKKHKIDSKRKIRLLEKLFPSKKITCGIVSDSTSSLAGFEKCEQFIPIVFQHQSIDLIDLARANTPKLIESTQKMLDIDALNANASVFNYFDIQIALSHQLQSGSLVCEISELVLDYDGLIKRVCWGAIENKILRDDNSRAPNERIVVLVDFTKIQSPKLRYFIYKKGVTEIFVTSKSDKVLNQYQPTLPEIKKFRASINTRSLFEYSELLEQVEAVSERIK